MLPVLAGPETVALIDNNLRAERGLSIFDMRHQFKSELDLRVSDG
jgi:hypothetical protein